jgi:hypothetical protein
MKELHSLEGQFLPMSLDVTVLSTYESVEKLINPQEAGAYDVILLDRDCKLCGSFHVLDIEKFGPEKVISISSTPTWSEEAKNRGVKRVVYKSFSDLEGFAKKVSREVKHLLNRKDTPKVEPNLVSFLDGSGTDHSGRYIEQVLEMEDSELEDNHDYIQWLFPLIESSNTVPNSPTLTNEDISLIKNNPISQDSLNMAIERMEQFYLNNNHWLTEYDHNHYRITRILKSLNLLLDNERAEIFLSKIMDKVNKAEGKVNEESILIWEKALKDL